MARAHRAEILHHLAQLRIVDVQADPVVPGSRAVDPPIRPGHERANLAAESGNDLAPLFHRVRRRVVHEQVHAPRLPRRAGDVVLAVEPERPARQVELVTVRQALLLHLPGAQVDGVEPRRPVVLLEVDLEHVPALAVGVRHHPALPDVHAARRLAQRFGLQDRRTFERLLQLRLLDDAPGLSGSGPTNHEKQQRRHSQNVFSTHDLSPSIVAMNQVIGFDAARRPTCPRARSQSALPGNPAAE